MFYFYMSFHLLAGSSSNDKLGGGKQNFQSAEALGAWLAFVAVVDIFKLQFFNVFAKWL